MRASAVVAYHDATKHHFHRFARALGYLDWATQPDPFRRFDGAERLSLPRGELPPEVSYADLFGGAVDPWPIDLRTLSLFLRYAMGLSAWKQYGASRWALRVNPSSGNLHPTECYVVWNARVCHYAPREHALEVRSVLPQSAVDSGAGPPGVIVGLSSVVWREAWKYGERAFRYCQHDVGHALAALRLSSAMLGWRLTLLPAADAEIAALLGLDRGEDFADGEREEPECVALVTPQDAPTDGTVDVAAVFAAARAAVWHGRANRLSPRHVDWPLIDEVASASRVTDGGALARLPKRAAIAAGAGRAAPAPDRDRAAAAPLLLRRRSATGYDARGALRRDVFFSMLARVQATDAAPWDLLDWAPSVHLVLFVHRVVDLVPGIYVAPRDVGATADLRGAMRAEFLWEPVSDSAAPLFLLAPLDVRDVARRLSCDQDIAADGFVSVAMLARFAPALEANGDWFYRRLFWECGALGQLLYLDAEAAGARGTGIGCFYDDAVHEVLGLRGHDWQSLYHFAMGLPVDDERLATEPGYDWEGNGARR